MSYLLKKVIRVMLSRSKSIRKKPPKQLDNQWRELGVILDKYLSPPCDDLWREGQPGEDYQRKEKFTFLPYN